jgi:hypothetical protein
MVETMNKRQLLAGGGALALAGGGVTYFGLRQMGSMDEYNASVAATRAALSEHPQIKDFIRYATLAASGHLGDSASALAGSISFRTFRAELWWWTPTQRFAFQATALGLKCAFINQPVEVAKLRPELAALVGIPGRRPDIVTRFGYGPTLPYSARRAIETTMLL